ncbi:Heme oxygenase 1 [Hibiscus syriacus]|uniref:heme oxygenase (biliverdin-producing) n=1 Tax=Hibiscus syriacus TaxID=106335 RepID=A0A6A3BB81_HIBSY|nr:heme oxygenase 1, chloroplastic-like [Hibiscus syriacus]KAE8714194.1 Heme oxygenase 1 [Hibiscus syriacus]
MASLAPSTQCRFLFKKPNPSILPSPNFSSSVIRKDSPYSKFQLLKFTGMVTRNVVVSAVTSEKPWKRYPEGETKGFVEEMRFVAMKLHTRQQALEGEMEAKAPEEQPVENWEPTLDGYLKFLVDSKLVYDTLEEIIDKASFPSYAEFRNTGLERSEKLAKDLEWFREKGYAVGEPSAPGITYAQYLKQLSDKDPQAFICHFYNVYFANSSGGRIISKKITEEIPENKELECYKWDGDLCQLLQNVKDKLNKVAENWSRDDKDRCLEETQKSFKFYRYILRLILT